MRTVSAFEAKTQLSRLLRRVSKGEQITITKHGVPVAMLVPVSSKVEVDRSKVIEKSGFCVGMSS